MIGKRLLKAEPIHSHTPNSERNTPSHNYHRGQIHCLAHKGDITCLPTTTTNVVGERLLTQSLFTPTPNSERAHTPTTTTGCKYATSPTKVTNYVYPQPQPKW